MILTFKMLDENALMPQLGAFDDVGIDLCVPLDQTHTIESNTTCLIDLGLTAHMTDNDHDGLLHFLKVEGRSSLALKGIIPVGGIIDPGYRGNIKVVLLNASNEAYVVNPGDKIAQLIIYSSVAALPLYGQSALTVRYENLDNKITNVVEEHAKTARGRGKNGFGSTGK